MLRLRVFILAALCAVVLWGAGLPPLSENNLAVATVSTRLTNAEADCIVGGQAGCLTEMKGAYDQCIRDNLVPGDARTPVVVLDCFGTGAWAGILCAFNWLWGLLF
jgi:hypothetical protein